MEEKHHRGGHRGPHHHEVLAPVLGYTLQSFVSKDVDAASELSRVALYFQIIEVGPQFVIGIPKVHITLVRDSQGRLAIDDIKVIASEFSGQPLPLEDKKECTSIVCKWMAYVEEKVGKPFRTCATKHLDAGHRPGRPLQPLQSHHKLRPGHFRPHQRTWGQLLKNIASHILLPVAIGIVAGVSASL